LKTMPARFAAVGDRHAGIDAAPCALDALLDLSAQQEREGQGDAPWPPNYKKQAGEPPRVQPSKRRAPGSAPKRRASSGALTLERRRKHPLIEIGRAPKKEDALAGVERWKARHPEAAKHLEPADILVDAMRGRHQVWWRIRINLQHVPEGQRPHQEPLDPDETPDEWASAARAAEAAGIDPATWRRRPAKPRQAR